MAITTFCFQMLMFSLTICTINGETDFTLRKSGTGMDILMQSIHGKIFLLIKVIINLTLRGQQIKDNLCVRSYSVFG